MRKMILGLIISLCSISAIAQDDGELFDLLICNGRVVDGTGNPWIYSDIGIIDGKIAEIGHLDGRDAVRVIDAQDLVVAPGFIDVHTHVDDALSDPKASSVMNYLLQGVTTVRPGADGSKNYNIPKTKRSWEAQGIGPNVALTVGYNALREEVTRGDMLRPLTAGELRTMQSRVRQSMKDGAWGVSAGIEYDGLDIYAPPEEIIEVVRPAAELGGFYMAHMRDEASEIIEAIQEMIQISEATGAPVNVTHIKVTGRANWGLMDDAVKLIDEARNRGIMVTADQYPFLQGAPIGFLTSLVDVPPEMKVLYKLAQSARSNNDADQRQRFVSALQDALEDDATRKKLRASTYELKEGFTSPVARWGWQDFRIMVAVQNSQVVDRVIAELAEEQGRDGFDVISDLIIDEPNILFASASQSSEDMRHALVQDWVMISSDGSATPPIEPDAAPVRGHPRSFASQAIALRQYVREEGVLTLEDAVRKMTTLPAQFLGLDDRGMLREGLAADLVIFDPNQVEDRATYADSRRYAEGFRFVIVNGRLSVDNGIFNGALNGKVLLNTYH